MPGVLGVFTGRDLANDGLGAIPPVAVFPGRDGKPMFAAAMPPLAVDRVRYVGEASRSWWRRRWRRRSMHPSA